MHPYHGIWMDGWEKKLDTRMYMELRPWSWLRYTQWMRYFVGAVDVVSWLSVSVCFSWMCLDCAVVVDDGNCV